MVDKLEMDENKLTISYNEPEEPKEVKWYNSKLADRIGGAILIIAIAVAYSICNDNKACNNCIDNHFKDNAAERSSLDYLVLK